MNEEQNKINNGIYLLKDLIQGDEKVANRFDFNDLTGEEVKEALKLIIDSPYLKDSDKKYLILNSWKIHYKTKPPTMKEFLTTKWIGASALSVYDHVKEVLLDFWSLLSPYRHLLFASCIGWGKSFGSTVSCLYVITHLWAMRNPKKFFGLAVSSSIVQALISFNLDKAKQVLLQPFFQILLTSSKFKRVRTEDNLLKRQLEFPDKICWTSAGKVGKVQFPNDIHIVIASSPAHILGLSLITAVLSEISFFLERGISPETIWRIYNDCKTRIYSRFSHKYFATTILDSSPNDMELSPIDKYIFGGNAYKDPLNYIITGDHWSIFPEKYPIYQKTKKIFYVYRGSGSKPPKIFESEIGIEKYSPQEILKVPIDIQQNFKDDLVKSIKDYAGWPSGSQSKVIDDFSIINNMFSPQLNNIYTYIYAPANAKPENLIWNQIKDTFFVEIGEGRYEFYRAPKEQRFIHVDQSESGNMSSITMVHPELNKIGEILQVVDFTILINPDRGKKINLDAIYYFLIDLKRKGRIVLIRKKVRNKDGKLVNKDFGKITFDQYQSTSTIQRLERDNFPVGRLSVDREVNPYITLVSWMSNYRIKSGRNIILKNNLKSLIEIRTDKGKKKIEHLKGQEVFEDGGNWEQSQMGINAKDCSDALCGATWNSIQEYKGIPRYQWVDDNAIILYDEKKDNDEIKANILKKINERFSIISKIA